MTTFEERFLQLKSEVEELKINIEEKVKIVIINRDRFDLAIKFEASLKNDNLRHDTMKDYTNAMFDSMHASNDFIKKISEKASNEFEDQINKLHKDFLLFDDSFRGFTKIHYETKSKIDEINLKMNKAINSEDIKLIKKELSPLSDITTKQMKDNKNEIERLEKLDVEINELYKKMEFMIDGFNSIIDFLDGNRTSNVKNNQNKD